MSFLVKNKLIKFSSILRLKGPKFNFDLPRPLSQYQVARIFEKICQGRKEWVILRNFLIIILMWGYGLRISEVLNIKKGDLFAAARFAAINASKKTSELIPLCHLLSLSNIRIDIDLCNKKRAIKITALCKTNAQTGVEMEALTAVSIGLLTIYDMLKAIDPFLTINSIRLLEKKGGKKGILRRETN